MTTTRSAGRASAGLDRSALATALDELAESESLLRAILDLAADSIVRFDPGLRYDYVNDRTVEISGIARDAWLGCTQAELPFADDQDNQIELRESRLRQVFESGEPTFFEDIFASDRGTSWYETRLIPQFDDQGRVAHVVAMSRDVSDRRRAQDALVRAAELDPLTGLVNRLALGAELDRAIDADGGTGLVTAVLFIDIDHFKHVNESLGHGVGDQLLRLAANRLHQFVREGDLIARHGGDEFVLVMRGLTDPADAVHAAMRIVEAFREPLVSGGSELSTTVSVGISLTAASRPDVDAGDLLREADTATYEAKAAGRDRISVFDEQLRARVNERLRIENELRGALRRGELEVWYQPEIDLTDGSIAAAEALLRWHHPSGEVYPAARFIDVAAESELIVELGDWVLREVCTQAARWQARGLMVRTNLDPRQIGDPELLDKVDAALGEAGIDGSILCAEITESALLHDTPTVQANLAGLTERGVAIALDDFGTGFASLTYLRRYHIDLIKIDRSFITDIGTEPHQQRLTAAIVALAHQLDMGVIAEGVEHEAQAAIVRDLGCAAVQGYLYSPAVPAHVIDKMLERSVRW